MIRYSASMQIGLKVSDITPDIDQIISSAKNVLVVCGYSFTNLSNAKSTLKKIANSPVPIKHCILPINLYASSDANRKLAVDLIHQGISVSVEAMNHSKWLMSENSIYFGSANFTLTSLEKRQEVVSIMQFDQTPPSYALQTEFFDFIEASMKGVKKGSYRSKLKGVLSKNDSLIKINQTSIKRFNPSIEKVTSTLENAHASRIALHHIIENSYWLLDKNSYIRMWQIAHKLLGLIGKIESAGIRIVEAKSISEIAKERYNAHYDNYKQSLDIFSNSIIPLLSQNEEAPDFSVQNRKMITKNLKAIATLKG